MFGMTKRIGLGWLGVFWPFLALVLLPAAIGSADFADWTYFRNVYINTSGTGAGIADTLYDFPLPIRLTSTSMGFSQAQSNGEDLRFEDSWESELSYEIELWSESGESAYVWVKMDTVLGDVDSQYITMYWGNGDAPTQSNAAAVFETSNDFYGVWHLGEDQSGTGTSNVYKDATSNSYDGDDYVSASGKSGVVGLGQELDGTDDRITMGDIISSAWDAITIEAWVYLDADLSAERAMVRKDTHLQLGFFPADNEIRNLVQAPTNGWTGGRDVAYTINAGTWYYFAFTYDNAVNELRNYAQGSQEGATATVNGSIADNIADLHIGWCESGSGDYIDGVMDEVRISNTARSADWIKLCYQTQRQGQPTVTFGPLDSNIIEYRTWDGGGTGSKWSTASNWSGDIAPDSTVKVLFDNTSVKACSLDVSAKVRSITMRQQYTGSFYFTAETLAVKAAADFSTGGAIDAGSGVLRLEGAYPFTPATDETFPDIVKTGTGTVQLNDNLSAGDVTVSNGELDFGTSCTHTFGSITGSGALDFSSSTVRVSGPTVNFGSMSSIAAGSGTLEFTGGSKQTFTPKSGATHPALVHSGSDTLALAADMRAASFSQTAGYLNLNSYNIEVTGNLSVTNGTASTFANLAGCTLTVGGNATFLGQFSDELNMNTASDHFLDVSGALSASYCNLGRSDASLGSQGLASNSINSLNNDNWDFDTDDYTTWSYQQKVFFNTTSSGADISSDVSQFPVPIRLDATNFSFDQALDGGTDIRFSRNDGTHLLYEVERWDSAGQEAEMWVKVDNVEAGTKTQNIIMHWGKASATNMSNPSSVFATSNGFAGVWHLAEETAGTGTSNLYLDATTNSIDGDDQVSATGQTGVIGRGQEFDGSNDRVDLGDFTSSNWSAMTVMAWARVDAEQSGERAVVRKEGQLQLGIFPSGNEVRNLLATSGVTGWTADNDESYNIATNTWYHLAFTYANGSSLKHFGNGAQIGGDKNVTGAITDNANGCGIGSVSDGSKLQLDGYIDEVRIENTARSADWIELC
ncbi:MAG: DUF2341 domain-containing protein, partial [Chitinivibrionales bacterium]|nr:DUF2341 domain-containing protein [Chitinivibrionales bacterium]